MDTDKRIVIGAACRFDDGRVSPEICNSLPVLQDYCNYTESCPFLGGLYCSNICDSVFYGQLSILSENVHCMHSFK